MEYSLYWVSALIMAVVSALIIIHEKNVHINLNGFQKSYVRLATWVLIFCVQDAGWGFIANSNLCHKFLFISSTVFHLSTVLTTFMWILFILRYLDDLVKHGLLYKRLYICIMTVQVIALIANFFVPIYFYVDALGRYQGAFLRPIAFLAQYIAYVVAFVVCMLSSHGKEGQEKEKLVTAGFFALPQVVGGLFQLLDPYAPFYGAGYFVSLILILLVLVSDERKELNEIKRTEFHRKEEEDDEEFRKLCGIDELTGLLNRRQYDRSLEAYRTNPLDKDLVYISMDVMEIKKTNEEKGHYVADEMLSGAATCIHNIMNDYGKSFRIGGDEFASIIFVDHETLIAAKEELLKAISEWKGKYAEGVSIALGFATARDNEDADIDKLIRLADMEMNHHKVKYYTDRGKERRVGQEIYNALCSTYIKILKVNLTDDTYEIVKASALEQRTGSFTNSLSRKFFEFGHSENVHPDSQDNFLSKTDINFLRDYFTQKRNCLKIFYKRRLGNRYRDTLMELFPAETYSDDNQILYIYVKDIDK